MFSTVVLKKFEKIKTPFYYYDLSLLKKTLHVLTSSAGKFGFIVHYALKANANKKILHEIKNAGIGADCVSGNEIKEALASGFKPGSVAFAGVGKTDEEIIYALNKNIFCFNCESQQEIEVINALAGKTGRTARVALRINPDINPNTHHYITTGLEENKFGINKGDLENVLKLLQKSKNIKLTGIHYHIGSQITDLSSFKSLCIKSNEIQHWLNKRNVFIEHINVGGGLGVDYHHPEKNMIPDFESYFKMFHDFLELQKNQKLHFELGRSVAAQCGALVSRALFIKKGVQTNFLILDAGMTELIRPALYQAYHKIENISAEVLRKSESKTNKGKTLKSGDENQIKYDVVGPICESSDCFGKGIMLPETKRGDLIAIRTAGAYGEVMSSTYNLRKKVKAYFGK